MYSSVGIVGGCTVALKELKGFAGFADSGSGSRIVFLLKAE